MATQTQSLSMLTEHRCGVLRSLSPDLWKEVLALADGLGDALASRDVDQELVARDALYHFLEGLADGALAELMALMWLGQEAVGEGREGFEGLMSRACQNLDYGACYLVGKISLAKWLRVGHERLSEWNS